jgi:carboxyl-terminal processing protease
MPDVFVPADTTGDTELIQDLTDRQLFSAFVIDKMQPALNGFDTSEDFLKNYSVSNDQFDNFIVYASQTIKEMNSGEVKTSRDNIKLLLKAYAARYKWGDSAYFEVLNSTDNTLKKAISEIN